MIILFRLLVLSFLLFACSSPNDLMTDAKDRVLVSIAPHRYFVHKIAGNTLDVQVLVPDGLSPHTYEPTPKDLRSIVGAQIWFQSGEMFEQRIQGALLAVEKDLKLVDMREGLSLIHGAVCHHHGHHHAEEADLHVWLSPLLAKQQAQLIAQALIERFPENQALFEDGLAGLVSDLDALHLEIVSYAQEVDHNQAILVSHPAFAYFCREYDIKQLSVEKDGQDPLPQDLHTLLQDAQAHHLHQVFLQKQYSNRGANLIADELGLSTAFVDPYAEDYVNNMRVMAQQFFSKPKTR